MVRRSLAAALIVVVAAALLVLAWPQLFGLQRSSLIAQAISFRGLAAVAALIVLVVVAVLAAASRRFRRLGASLAIFALAFVLLNAVVLGSRGFGNTVFQPKRATDVTVVSWNTLGGAPGAAAIATLALGARADIVSLPETDRETADEIAAIMTAAGRPMTPHTTAFDTISKARSTSVLVSRRLGRYSVDSTSGSTTTLPTVILRPDSGSGPTIVAAHPVAPIPDELANWSSDLKWLSGACRSPSVIMAGDFNATLDHLVGFGDSYGKTMGRCTDAALRSGNGAVGTWPTAMPALFSAPIDHVMATENWRVSGMRVVQNLDGAGSDHRPIIVQLSADH
jgi:endonuclease/exonuclease/phosphatase (EEP) superfamily protein YafD